jgi:hypothetical protein
MRVKQHLVQVQYRKESSNPQLSRLQDNHKEQISEQKKLYIKQNKDKINAQKRLNYKLKKEQSITSSL